MSNRRNKAIKWEWFLRDFAELLYSPMLPRIAEAFKTTLVIHHCNSWTRDVYYKCE
ncbi:hypothetical protein TNCV_993471, partial [Trichonephila clavipes]